MGILLEATVRLPEATPVTWFERELIWSVGLEPIWTVHDAYIRKPWDFFIFMLTLREELPIGLDLLECLLSLPASLSFPIFCFAYFLYPLSFFVCVF